MSKPELGSRLHFGSGKLSTEPNLSVFINCPFDNEFLPLFDAIVFATVCCGFLPRSALESGNVAESRIDRIIRTMFSSKYSIHDLTRCTGAGDENLARFNMPLELGIAMARRFVSDRVGEDHDWLVLVPEGHQYLRFISDLAAYDPKQHDGTVASVVPKVMSWLATRLDAVRTPTPKQVLEALPAFIDRKRQLADDWSGDVPWADLVAGAVDVAREQWHEWSPGA